VLPRRYARSDEGSSFTDSERHLILAAETLRSGDTAGKPPREGDKAEEKMSMFWRVFGGTILSITALMFFNAYQSLANNIHEVRTDLGRVRESSGEYIKKDDFNARNTTLWTGIRDAQGVVPTVTVLTSKVSALEGQLAAAERERKEMQSALLQLPAMKERDAALEKLVKDGEAERRDMCRELLQLRERMAKLEGLQEAKPNGVKPAVATVPAKKEP
jgi:hypothetical protein